MVIVTKRGSEPASYSLYIDICATEMPVGSLVIRVCTVSHSLCVEALPPAHTVLVGANAFENFV